jgi:site-specific recombinase XerD
MAPETIRAWERGHKAFFRWCADQARSALPATGEVVAEYVDALALKGDKPATIRQAVWSISVTHRMARLPDPAKAEEVRMALKRMARTIGTRQGQAAALVEDDMRLALRAAGPSPSLATLRDLALALVMRDLLARRSEAVALMAEDVTRGRDGSATVLIRRGKTDQEGAGEVRWLSPRTVEHLTRWLAAAEITTGPIFHAVNKAGRIGLPLTAPEVPRILRRIAKLAGIDAKGVSGHSCRVGMAQDLAASGAELPELMQAGRWKSPTMPARYTERQAAGRGAVARFYSEKVRA